MALKRLALATWLGVRARYWRPPARIALSHRCVAGGCGRECDEVCNCTVRTVVITVAALTVWRLRGSAAGLTAGVVMAIVTLGALAIAYRTAWPLRGGDQHLYASRASGTDSSPGLIMLMSARWAGINALLGIAGAAAITYAWRHWPTTLLAWTLAGAAFLAPAEQARIHTYVSLFKHVGYGAWFASAVPAGDLLAALPRAAGQGQSEGYPRVVRHRGSAQLSRRLSSLVLVGGLIVGAQYRGSPDSRGLTAALTAPGQAGGRYLAEDYDVPAYYLMHSVRWTQWSNTFNFSYTDPSTHQYLQNAPAYADAIRHRYFAVIALAFGDPTQPTRSSSTTSAVTAATGWLP